MTIKIKDFPLENIFSRALKRGFDILFSAFIIVFFISWMYPIFGLVIKLQSRGPIIYRQLREGKNGVNFWCFKFRSMYVDEVYDNSWTKVTDPRVTRFGVFLRRTSLDEFPQFLNVFLGNMSTVGPRPHPTKLNDLYRDRIQKFSFRHKTKPGVTGLSQMKGYRGSISKYHQINSRVRLDRFYIQNWTFLFDLKIIILTIPATLYWGLSSR